MRIASDAVGAERPARAEHVTAVCQIAAEIEGFLAEWVRRFKRVLDECRDSVGGETDTRRMVSEFEAERRRWEAQRQRDVEHIEDEAGRLIEAWLRVEAEQRRLLQARESIQLRTREGGNVPPAANRDPLESSGMSTGPVSVTEAVEGPPSTEDVASSRAMAVRQFEQLRREIGNHNRETR